jgi:hypothetical protein
MCGKEITRIRCDENGSLLEKDVAKYWIFVYCSVHARDVYSIANLSSNFACTVQTCYTDTIMMHIASW